MVREHMKLEWGQSGVFSYSLTPTKKPRLVTFNRKVKLQKLEFLLLYGVQLVLAFDDFLA